MLGEASSSYPVSAPQPGWAETDPSDWWQGTCEAVRQAVGEHAQDVSALGLSGQMHGVVLCREDGTPLRPAILWADMRSSATLESYWALGSEQRSRLANPVAAGSSIYGVGGKPDIDDAYRQTVISHPGAVIIHTIEAILWAIGVNECFAIVTVSCTVSGGSTANQPDTESTVAVTVEIFVPNSRRDVRVRHPGAYGLDDFAGA